MLYIVDWRVKELVNQWTESYSGNKVLEFTDGSMYYAYQCCELSFSNLRQYLFN